MFLWSQFLRRYDFVQTANIEQFSIEPALPIYSIFYNT
ncbi:hypothetical protein C427_1244 [Paraglaciecola psychrophila 170]|uniref:Uncharacterized protein n=1 Tax=Paraglaciecola psychrophila 170 TaxID=1129794 RepID=K6Z036_9ALTE|nr:hypothetical protein C427_1244 [Paraglaciecola psychrophila 170]GAC38394.1 hypothetical protein GPSY_2782 [Paraglaciecola psychrophila 170]